MGEYFAKDRVRPLLRFLSRIGMIAAAILFVNALGIWVVLFSQGQQYILTFSKFLATALLLEGSIIGAVGGFLFLAFSMHSAHRVEKNQTTDSSAVDLEAKRRRERRLSRQKWASAMLVLGVLVTFLGFALGS